MGGSSKSTTTPTSSAASPVGNAPSVLALQAPASSLVADQLAQGGLLGAVTNPGLLYSAMNVPILDNPAMLRKWMQDQGMPYLDAEGKTIAPPAKAAASTSSASTASSGAKTAPAKSGYRLGGQNGL